MSKSIAKCLSKASAATTVKGGTELILQKSSLIQNIEVVLIFPSHQWHITQTLYNLNNLYFAYQFCEIFACPWGMSPV